MNYCFFPSWFGSQSHLIWEVVSFSIIAWSLFLVWLFASFIWWAQNEAVAERKSHSANLLAVGRRQCWAEHLAEPVDTGSVSQCCESWPEPEYLSPQEQGHLSSLCRLLSLQISLELRYLSWGIEPPQPMYSWKFTHCHPKTHEYLGLLSTRFSIRIIPQGQPQDFYHLKEEGWYCELVRDSCEGKATTSLLSSFRYKFQPLLSCFLSVVTEETNYMWQVDELIL